MKYEINFPLKNKSEKISLKQSGQISNVIINTCSIHVKYKVIIISVRICQKINNYKSDWFTNTPQNKYNVYKLNSAIDKLHQSYQWSI